MISPWQLQTVKRDAARQKKSLREHEERNTVTKKEPGVFIDLGIREPWEEPWREREGTILKGSR